MKPSGYSFQIDWSNPLSTGLIGFYLQGAQVYDVVKGDFVPKSGNAPEVNTSEGTATQYDGTTYFTPPAPNDEFNVDTVTLTVVAADWKTTGRPIHEPIIGKGDNQYAMKGSSGALEFFTYRPTTYFDVSYAPTEGQSFIASGTANNDFLRLYVDGAEVDNQPDTGAGLIATSAFPLELGRNSQNIGRLCSDQNIVLTCIHDRVLSAQEVADLHANVYQLLRVVPFSAAFNFRATAGYVTDGPNETYVLADTYPTLRDGSIFGWAALAQERDRNASNPPELAGVHFVWNNGADTTFVCESGAGDFNIRLALGDAVPNEIYAEIVDLDASNVVQNVLATVSSGTALNANEWIDASGVVRVGTSDWVDNNVSLVVSTSQPRLGIRIGDPTNTSTAATSIAHLSIETASIGSLVQSVEVPAGDPSTGTLASAPTAGNLLLFVANAPFSWSTVTTPPTGFTELSSYDGDWNTRWYYKISDGTETSATIDWSHGGGYGHYIELYWQQGVPTSVQITEDVTNVSGSNTGPQSTGTLTPTNANNLCVGLVTASTGNLANQGQVWTGLEPVADIPDQSNPGSSVGVALDQNGAVSGSLDWTDGGPSSYGALVIFNYSDVPSINIVNVQSREGQFSAATTLNYTLPVNADQLVIAHYADYGPQGRNILGATWDGNAATQIQIADDDGADGRIVSAFIYDVSALGAVTADAVVNLDSAGSAHIICFCLESEGDINYRTPSAGLNGSSASISNSITSELSDLVLSFIGWDDQTDAGTTKDSGQATVGVVDQSRGLLGIYSQLAAGTTTVSDFSVPGADSYGSFGVAFYATAPVTALEDVVINFHGGTPASVAGKTINNVQGTTAGQVLSNLLSYDTGADQGFAATVSAAITASTGGRAVGATTLDQAIFPEGGYVSDPPIPSNYTITLDVPANVTSVDLGIYSATTFGSQVNVDFSANGVSVTGHSSTDNTDGTVVVLAGVVPNGSNQIVIDYTGNSSQFIFNNGLRIYNIVTSGGGGGPAQLASDLSGSGTLTADLTVPTDTTLQSSLSGTGTLLANLTLPSDQLACDLSATGTLTANLAGPFVAPVSDTFAGSGALASHWQNFNAAAIPGVERVAGYLEGDITDNTSDVTTWLDDLRGRLDYQDAKVPDSGTEEYSLTNVGVGPVADPRANLPYNSQLAFAGIVIHDDDLGAPGVAADANYEFLVVGHRGGSQQATLEWKATNAGTSSVGHEGANTLGTNVTHADIAVEINSIGEARFKYRAANSSDPWIYINGGSGRTFAPIAWGASGSRFKIGIIGYTLGSSAIPFTYSVDAFSAPSTSVVSNLNGTGTLTANLTIPADTLQSDLNATGTITANLTIPADTLQSNLNATGILTANLTVPADNLQSDLSATGTLTANLTIPADTLQSVLNGSGTLTANLVIPTDTLQSDLNATGILTANLTVPADQLSASLNGSGNLSANLTIPGDPLASDLSGTGTLTADLTVSTGALLRVDLVGNGNLVANMVVPADTLQADLVGTGRLIANLNGEDSPIIVIELTGEYIPVIEITSREDTIFYSGNDLNLSVAVIDDSTGQELNVSSIINARYALESCDGTLSISKELGNGISVDTETNRVIISMDRSDTIDRSGRHYHHELAIQTATGFSTVFESEVLIKDSLFDA